MRTGVEISEAVRVHSLVVFPSPVASVDIPESDDEEEGEEYASDGTESVSPEYEQNDSQADADESSFDPSPSLSSDSGSLSASTDSGAEGAGPDGVLQASENGSSAEGDSDRVEGKLAVVEKWG